MVSLAHDSADVLKQALRLPAEDRAAIAGLLLDSLDETVDDDLESLWAEELRRRLAEIDQEGIELIPWDEARRRIAGP